MDPEAATWRFGKKLSTSEVRRATAHLSKKDPKLASVISKVGRLSLHDGLDPFDALMISIIFQQLAGSAAEAIAGRFRALYGGRLPKPAELMATSEAKLRGTGLSRRKIEYLRDLARRVDDGSLDLLALGSMDDEEVISLLDEVRGIGRWTAQMFLIFTLGRLDVLPTGDLGIRGAVRQLYGLGELPSESDVLKIGSSWHPYCTVASLYLWRLSEVE